MQTKNNNSVISLLNCIYSCIFYHNISSAVGVWYVQPSEGFIFAVDIQLFLK